ncbi:MAG: twin-arginine translocase TatA/TatE family subunit [Actinobacteria bacterium]|nr:twin-arginine translocase TatA/TatE family subunit [Actinomycetota bacterium]
MFNFSGSEIVFLLLIALVVLGPEKLPEAIRRFGKTYVEFKKVTTGFQSELKSALDEPMREMRETADAFKKAATLEFDASTEPDSKPEAAPAATGSAPPLASSTPAATVPASAPEPETVEPEPVEAEPVEPETVARGIDSIVVRDAPVAKAPAPADGEQGAAPA